MGNRGVMASFLGCLILITYRDFKTPDSSWPLGPVPPPYRFTWSAVVFGILAIVSDVFSPRIATVVAVGVLMGVLYQVLTGASASAGLKSVAPGYSDTHNPINNGATGSTPQATPKGSNGLQSM
jgi:hypothetical protein